MRGLCFYLRGEGFFSSHFLVCAAAGGVCVGWKLKLHVYVY